MPTAMKSFQSGERTLCSRLWSVVFALAVGALLSAQDEPDFSGRWVLESSSQPGPDTPRALSIRQSVVRTNVHGKPMKPFYRDIAGDREYEGGTYSETHLIGVVGGVVPGVSANGSPTSSTHLRHAVKWDGHALVFERGSYSGQTPETGVWVERREVWTLDLNGRLRLVITTRNSDDVSRAVTLLYRRP